MKKNNDRYIDLSLIKDDDMDKTASFTDLMSREEKKERQRRKLEEETRELKEILMNDEEAKELKKKRKKKKEKLEEALEDEITYDNVKEENEKDVKVDNFSKTQKLIDLTNELKLSMLNNVSDNLNDDDDEDAKKKPFKIGNIILTDFLIIISLAYYIYTIIFTNIQTSQLYLLIGGAIILAMILFFCLSIISKRILSKAFSIIIYLIFIGYIVFNLTLILGVIHI